MKVPLSWLDEWVPCRHLSVEALTDHFTDRGFPIENVDEVGGSFENVVVGRVIEVKKHPQADRLVVCRVDAGGEEPLSIVCGAPNVVANMMVPVALVGAVLPGGIKIKRSKIRGEVSQGMLCSPQELQISDDHEGILSLSEDAVIGTAAAAALKLESDTIIEMEIHYNRPDVMSIAGVARELSATLGTPVRKEMRARLSNSVEVGGNFHIHLEDPEGCPRYLGAIVRGIKIGPSPKWMQERLERAGVRPLYNVVDITNYVLMELGQPLHAFDLKKIEGPEIRVRRAKTDETIQTLDGRDRKLNPENLVIADSSRALALAGIMGGKDSEVTESTTDILLESAYFDPYRIQVTANALTLMTEASRRFGRGVDPNLPPIAMQRALALLEEIADGTVESPVSESAAKTFDRPTLELSPKRVNALLGIEISSDEMTRHLAGLDFEVSGADPLQVRVPTYRGDVREPVDLIEEIGRAYGLENLPDAPIGAGATGLRENPIWDLEQKIREAMVGLGFSEVLTPSLGNTEKLSQTWSLTHDSKDETPRLEALMNPPSPESSVLRSDLAAGLLDVVAHNLHHGADSIRIFEIGRVFTAPAGETAGSTEESTQVAFALSGIANVNSWEGEREFDFYDAKGAAEALLARLGVDSLDSEPYPSRAWKSGESAELRAPAPVGWVGCFEPRRARAWKLERPVFLFVAPLASLFKVSRQVESFVAFSRFPAVKRDLAFFVPIDVSHSQIEKGMRKSAGKMLNTIRLFDVYRGRGVPEGQKSLAYSLHFSHPERTLQENEVETLQDKIVRQLGERFGATLREQANKG